MPLKHNMTIEMLESELASTESDLSEVMAKHQTLKTEKDELAAKRTKLREAIADLEAKG